MNSNDKLNLEQIFENVTSAVQPATGGTLCKYVDYFKFVGRPALLSDDGTQAWVEGVKSQFQRLPLECTEPVDSNIIKKLFGVKGIRVVSYMLDDGNSEPNCFDYVCSDKNYTLENLNPNARRDIRRGLRNFTIRLCSWDELIEKGFAAHEETYRRHDYVVPPKEEFERIINLKRETPFYDIWGAWQEGELAAWMTVYKIDDWAMIDLARSMTKSLKLCPNNALCYIATKYMIDKQKRRYVSYGASSVQVNVNELSMHKYKIKMGYQAVPMHLKFELKPMLRPFICWPVSSWIWEKLAVPLGRVSAVRKIAGMSRLLSGREEDPLAWARNDISQGK